MEFFRFAPDYARIDQAFSQREHLSNPTELLWSDNLHMLLRLCGMNEREIGSLGSDYEKFKAFCAAFPILGAHPVRKDLLAFLHRYFPKLPTPSSVTCDTLWEEISRDLVEGERRKEDFLLTEPWNCLVSSLTFPTLPHGACPMLDAMLLLENKASSYEAWKGVLASIFADFASHGSRQVRFSLDHDFRFLIPDLYHVNRALSAEKRGEEEQNLLLSQLFRETSELCRKYELQLLLDVDCTCRAINELLTYTEMAVGLPTIYWSSKSSHIADNLIRFQARSESHAAYWTLKLQDFPSEYELTNAILAAGARYPLTRLCFITASDARLCAFSRERVQHVFDEVQKKL